MTDRPVSGVPIEDLLSHAPWLGQVARRLVREPGVADDVVQETWLTALRCPPLEAENLRGWLARTLQNLVRQRARSERSRSERERSGRGASREIPLSPEALVQGAEMQRMLAEEVMGLREPFRTTVLRRYYEGLEPTRIAELEGVPAGTVRWRLKRGLELLREQMDERAERDTWRMGLLALVGADVLGHGQGMLASSLLSPLSISSVPKAVLIVAATTAAAALLAVAGTLRTAEVESRPPAEPAGVALLAPISAQRTPLGARAPARTSADRSSLTSASDAVARVTGRILRLDPYVASGFVAARGVAVAGLVRDCDDQGTPLESSASPLASVSDDAGFFELHVAPGPHGAALRLRAGADDLHATEEASLFVPSTGEDYGTVELLLVPHGSLVGRTVDAEGHAVGGVELVFEDDSVRSDERGRFWLAGYGGQSLLTVARDGYDASAEVLIGQRSDGSWAPARVMLLEGRKDVTLARALLRESHRCGTADFSITSGPLSSRWGASVRETTWMRNDQYLVGSTAGHPTPGPGESSSWTGVPVGRALSTTAESLRRAGIRNRSSGTLGFQRTGFRREGALLGFRAQEADVPVAALLHAEAEVHGMPSARHAWCALGQHPVAEDPEALFASTAAAPACRVLVEDLGRLLAVALPPDPRPDSRGAHSDSMDGLGRSTPPATAANRSSEAPSGSSGSRPYPSGHADFLSVPPQAGAETVVGPVGVRANS